MNENTTNTTTQSYRRVVFLTAAPTRLPELGLALRQLASGHPSEAIVWLAVERFRAPSSTPLPYRTHARIEARNITAERVATAEVEASAAIGAWTDFGWQTKLEVLLDAASVDLIRRLRDSQTDLIVAAESDPCAQLAARASELTGCPLLLVPTVPARPAASRPVPVQV